MQRLRRAATAEGFLLAGVTPAVASTGYPDLVRWIESGYAGEMDYFADRQDAYRHPSGVLEGVRSIVALVYPYEKTSDHAVSPGHGKIARYAWSGDDYHDVVHPRLKRLCEVIIDDNGESRARGIIDTAPLLEREIAQEAGLGWRGKNTLLLNKQLGSFFFLAFVLTDVELPYDLPHQTDHCGTCTACLDACPTDAFPEAGVLDATRCISYLTIEHRGHIRADLREGIGDWLFGCDVCQEVCPWNHKPSRRAAQVKDAFDSLDLYELFAITDDEFRQRFRKTPLWRTRRKGVLRNAAIVLGNQRDASAVNALVTGLNDDEAIVRGASAWALGRIGGDRAAKALTDRLRHELDDVVASEIRLARSSSAERRH